MDKDEPKQFDGLPHLGQQAGLRQRYEADGPEESEKPDPWAGRKRGMRCETCIWFVPKKGAVGRCRRHAPTMSGFPVVFENDWCGDHKLDEDAVR